jgi:hypothetical protein
MGLTIEQWDELDDYQRAHALAPDLIDAERAAGRCAACGGPASECQDPDNQHAYVVSLRRCFRTRALEEAKRARKSDHDGVLFAVTLDPTRKKSAQKGASRG